MGTNEQIDSEEWNNVQKIKPNMDKMLNAMYIETDAIDQTLSNQFCLPDSSDQSDPDFVKYAESFGARGYRIENTDDLLPVLQDALASKQVCIIDCPVDYRENLKLTEKLGEMVCPV